MVKLNRLSPPFGRWINTNKLINFRFEGQNLHGLEGDCITSALLANQQWLLSRSFKYHRPRGVLTLAGQDANSLVQLKEEPNVNADIELLCEGMDVYGQNYNGSLTNDKDAKYEALSRFMPVGFYYRTFFKPKGIWKFWENYLRKKAGLGIVSKKTSDAYFDKQYLHYDVVVVGAGLAGIVAALEVADKGCSTLLVDENRHIGGSLNYERSSIHFSKDQDLSDQLKKRVKANELIDVKTNATVNGWFEDHYLPIITENRLYKVRAKHCIMATGSIEQPAVFRNNDLLGIVLGSAVQRMMRLYGINPGKCAVVLAGNDEAYGVALDLIEAGIKISAVVDLREQLHNTERVEKIRNIGIRILANHAVYEAIPDKTPEKRVTAVEVRAIRNLGQVSKDGEKIKCDLVCMSTGYMPAYQLLCQGGATLSYDDDLNKFKISNLHEGVSICGSVAGYLSQDSVISSAKSAAFSAVCAVLSKEKLATIGQLKNSEEVGIDILEKLEEVSANHPWPIFAHPKGREFVDFDEDLQIKDIVNATHYGYEDIQLVKRFTTAGMGPSQGRHSALTTARLVANATQRSVGQVGVTTARPPFGPEKLSHLAGRIFEPIRYSPMHELHVSAGAQMLNAGLWLRPAFYGDASRKQELIVEEANQVRQNVGIIDVSTLGGIEVLGPDAGEFLNRIYTFGFIKQPVGRSRYLVMTNEEGIVIDDGVSCRFGEEHYYVTASTGGVDTVYRNMLKWNAQWNLDINVMNVSTAYAGVNIAGPNSRRVLEAANVDIDISPESFPYLAVKEGNIGNIPARFIRVGFVGELGYEIHIPSSYGRSLWQLLLKHGKAFGIRPFGVETQRLLRLEKGHIIIGQDTDATTTPREVNLSWAVSKKKPFFVGKRSLQIYDTKPKVRQQVGYKILDDNAPIIEECHLVIRKGKMVGRVTSVGYSPIMKCQIGLAFVAPDQAQIGSHFEVIVNGHSVIAEVVKLPFYDPENKRQEM